MLGAPDKASEPAGVPSRRDARLSTRGRFVTSVPGESHAATRLDVTPDACRRFFFERGDLSLGIMPQLLLDEKEADLWSLFWYACRQADDAVERGELTGAGLARSLHERRTATPAEQAIQTFLREAQPYFEEAPLQEGMARALAALDQEGEFRQPPPAERYLQVIVDKAGFPLLVLNTLLLKGEPGSAVQRFSYLLSVSIQLGDDSRDLARDRARGVRFVTQEEINACAASELDADSEPGLAQIRQGRENVCKWMALRALEVADRFVARSARDRARTEVFLWLYQIETGQLREAAKPLKWPGPLGDFLQGGALTAPRLAAARALVRNNPSLFGDPRRWDDKNRHAVLKLVTSEVPSAFRSLLGPDHA